MWFCDASKKKPFAGAKKGGAKDGKVLKVYENLSNTLVGIFYITTKNCIHTNTGDEDCKSKTALKNFKNEKRGTMKNNLSLPY